MKNDILHKLSFYLSVNLHFKFNIKIEQAEGSWKEYALFVVVVDDDGCFYCYEQTLLIAMDDVWP